MVYPELSLRVRPEAIVVDCLRFYMIREWINKSVSKKCN